jgi:hypothetical protein
MPQEEHDELFLRVRLAVNSVDPAGFFRYGFPEDEYNPEVKGIYARLKSGEPISEELVRDVLMHFLNRAEPQHVAAIVAALDRE